MKAHDPLSDLGSAIQTLSADVAMLAKAYGPNDCETIIAEATRRAIQANYTPGNYFGFLKAVVTTTAIDHARKARRHGGKPDGAIAKEPSTKASWGLTTDLATALFSLNDQDRLVALCRLVGFTVRETATALGMPPSTVDFRWQRIRSNLRLTLDDYNPAA